MNRVFKKTLCLAIEILLTCTLLSAKDNTVATNVCAIAAHPRRFDHKHVQVKARVETAVIEGGVWLEDDSCPDRTVYLFVPDSMRRNPEQSLGYRDLFNAIYRTGNLGTVDKQVIAEISGQLSVQRKRPTVTLTLDKAKNVELKMKKMK